jgi:hypothetical protein
VDHEGKESLAMNIIQHGFCFIRHALLHRPPIRPFPYKNIFARGKLYAVTDSFPEIQFFLHGGELFSYFQESKYL